MYVGNSTFTSLKSVQDLNISTLDFSAPPLGYVPEPFSRLVQKSANGTLQKLPPDHCISAYATYYQTKYGSLMLITDDTKTTNGDFINFYVEPVMNTLELYPAAPYAWMCDDFVHTPLAAWSCSSRIADIRSNSAKWVVDGYKVDYCLAEALPQTCTLEFSLPLALVVTLSNLMKVVVICATAFHLRNPPLLTVGDAVASFIRQPDEATKSMCLLSREMVSMPQSSNNSQLQYDENPKQWMSSLSTQRWVACLLS